MARITSYHELTQVWAWPWVLEFKGACYNEVQYGLSHPQIVRRLSGGELYDDYREAYNWLAMNTPEDARVMAWWGYRACRRHLLATCRISPPLKRRRY